MTKNLNFTNNIGWQGKNCDVQSCRYRPCLNHGTCSGVLNNVTNSVDYVCLCPQPYSGEFCDKNGNKRNLIFVARINFIYLFS